MYPRYSMYHQTIPNPDTSGKTWNKADLPSTEEDQITEYLNKLNIYKSTGSASAEGADVTVRPLLIIFERSWQWEEASEDEKKSNYHSYYWDGPKGDSESYRPVSFSLLFLQVME